MPMINVGDVSLYYEESGSGRTTVFVHGIPTDYRAWAAQVGPFSEGRRMVALSRRYAFPNVRQGDLSDSTIQNNAADLKGFIQNMGEGPVDLVGHSYGGFISAFFAAANGAMVRYLVLVEPAVSTLLVADQTSGSQVLGLLLRSPSVALSGRRFQSGSLRPALKALESGDLAKATELNVDGILDEKGSFKRMSEERRKMMLDNARTVGEQKTIFPRFTAAEAAKISCPTLIVNGERTAPWLRKIGELLNRAIPNSRAVRISGARHFPHMENPGEFNAQVLAFLNRG